MVHVWYVEYGDLVHNVDPSAIYEQVLAEIHKQDPSAYIEEIRQYKYQIAFYVNHPEWTKADFEKALKGLPTLIDPITGAILIIIGIAAILAATGFVITAWTVYQREFHQYTDEDPETGDKVTFATYSEWLSWLSVHKPEAFEALKRYGATNWWEAGIQIMQLLLVLGAVGIGAYLLLKFLR